MSKELLAHAMELLAPLGTLRSRRMFGGWGLYVDDLFIAILAFEELYLKADAVSAARFETAGCKRFAYMRQGQLAQLNYYCPPEEALESPALMRPWARLAMEASLRARNEARPQAEPATRRSIRRRRAGPAS